MEDNRENIIKVDIADEMKKSYIDYAMSVIVSRALPDVRDGLKPVHRRILYAMKGLGLYPDKGYRKSVGVVGEVLGKYHPHGDTSVYNTMVRLAQDFSTRYMLVDGHGNFGSIDGDSAAAMRYTEAKLAKISTQMLRDIDKETVDFVPNFDERLEEPTVLPSRFPNLLVNGSSGIAVGMATSIPPHNLGEVIDAVVKMIDDPDIDIEDIIKIIKGPDFPTGAIIMGKDAIKEAYRTGKGRVTVRSEVEIEDIGKGKSAIIVKEIPYQVNKSKMIEGIANLVRNKKIEGITDLRDESNRKGIKVVIELKKDINANVVLNKLYKHSQLQTTFSIIMIALVNGEPKVLNLYQVLKHYLNHQKDVVTRRTEYELRKAEARAHILEGLKIALDNIDAIISLIRGSKNVADAKEGLMKSFKLSDIQAQAILDMRLQKLTGLEREKIDKEYEELIMIITKLKEILANERLLLNIVKEEILEVKEKYRDKRRTRISKNEDDIDMEDLIDEEDVFITLTHMGYVKRVPAATYSSQRRGGKGISGLSTREEDFVEDIFITSTHNHLLFFTNYGKMHRLKAYEIPEAKRQAKGTNIVNLLYLEPSEKITAVIPIKEFSEDGYLVMATKNGMIKKSELSQFNTSRKTGLIAMGLKQDDELMSVKLTDGNKELILVTAKAMSIRFSENDVRNMGRAARGVKSMNINKDDYLVGMGLIDEGTDLLVVSENGYGKRTSLNDYRIQSRSGKGIKTYSMSKKTGKLVGAKIVNDNDEIMIINTSGIVIRLKVNGISRYGRSTRGVKLMKINEDDSVVSIAKVAEAENLEE